MDLYSANFFTTICLQKCGRLALVWLNLGMKILSFLYLIWPEGVHNDRFMVRNPDTSPDQPAILFTNPAQEYDDAKFVPAEMKAGKEKQNKKNGTYIYIYIFILFIMSSTL